MRHKHDFPISRVLNTPSCSPLIFHMHRNDGSSEKDTLPLRTSSPHSIPSTFGAAGYWTYVAFSGGDLRLVGKLQRSVQSTCLPQTFARVPNSIVRTTLECSQVCTNWNHVASNIRLVRQRRVVRRLHDYLFASWPPISFLL